MIDVSVIIPYNRDRGFLREAVASAKASKYVKVEVILANGDQTLGKNFNQGLRRATGKYVKILAEDDLLTVSGLFHLVKAMESYDFVCANSENFGRKNYIMKSVAPASLTQLLQRNTIHGGTVLYRRDILVAVGGMDESIWTGEELELHYRLLSKGYKCGYVDATVCRYRLHDAQKSIGASVATAEYKRRRVECINSFREKYKAML
ncbi:MAG TPA: glycosyltransferase [Bacteroidales bacterium]|nr:glycosyltransferase [Bacteroidales bacterium]